MRNQRGGNLRIGGLSLVEIVEVAEASLYYTVRDDTEVNPEHKHTHTHAHTHAINSVSGPGGPRGGCGPRNRPAVTSGNNTGQDRQSAPLKRGDFDLRVRAGAPSLVARRAAQHGGYGRSRQHGSVLPAWPKGWGGPREFFRSVLPGLEPARARFMMRKA